MTELPNFKPTAVVSLALASHLDAYGHGSASPTGRQLVQSLMGFPNPARVTELLAPTAAPDRLLELAVVAERAGLVPYSEITGFAAQVRMTSNHRPTVSAAWWPRLRDANDLATNGQQGPRSVTDVLVCAEAFCDYYYDLLAKPPNSTRQAIKDLDRRSLDTLVRDLCRFATGPYGVAQEALRLVSRLVSLCPETVSEETSRNPISTQLILAFDTSVRHYPINARLWRTFTELLANPPDLLAVKVNWMRGLRRLLVTDRTRRAALETRGWVVEQLKIAMRSEGSYEESSAKDRRFALWCLAELVENDSEWRATEKFAQDQRDLHGLLPACREFRISARGGYSGFIFTPERGWDRPRSAVEILDPGRSRSKSWSERDRWRVVRPGSREQLVGMLGDALLAPSAIRQRAATDVLRFSGEQVRMAVSGTTAHLIDLERESKDPRIDYLERCFRVLGAMGQDTSIDCVERLLRDNEGSPLVQTAAIGAAADLGHRHPTKAIGMMAWMNRAISTSTTRGRAILGIRAATAFGKEPLNFFESLPCADDTSVLRCLDWSRSVLDDRLRPPNTNATVGPSARAT